MLVKSNFDGDIRRFQVDDDKLGYEFLVETLAAIYHTSADQFSLLLSKDGDTIPIYSQEELERQLQTFVSSTLRVILRTVEIDSLEPEDRSQDFDMDMLFEREDFRRKLDEYLYGTYGLRPIQQKIQEEEEEREKEEKVEEEEEEGEGEEVQKEEEEGEGEAIVNEEQESQEEEEEGQEDKGDSDPESFVVVGKEKNEDQPQRTGISPPFFIRSILAFIKGLKKENRQNNAEEAEPVDIPNMEEMLSRLEEMGFTDREANIESLKFHYKFNEGVDEVVEELLLSQNNRPAAEEKVEEVEQEGVDSYVDKEEGGEEEVEEEEEEEEEEEGGEEGEAGKVEYQELESDYLEEEEKQGVSFVSSSSSSESDSSEEDSDEEDTDEDTQSCSSIPVDGFPEGLNARDIVELMNRAGITKREAIRALKTQDI